MRHRLIGLLAPWLASWLLVTFLFPLLSWHQKGQEGDLCLATPAAFGSSAYDRASDMAADSSSDSFTASLAACGYCLLGLTHPGDLPHWSLPLASARLAESNRGVEGKPPVVLFWTKPPVRAPPAFS